MEFFHPAPLAVAVEALSRKDVHSSENHLKLVVDSLGRSTLFVPTRHPTFSPQNFESSHYLEQNKTGLIKALDDGSFSSTDDLNIERIQSHLQSHEQHPAPFEPVPQLSNLAFQSDPSMFYSQSESSHRPTKYDLVNDYNAKTYYNWAHLEIVARPAASHDEKLALYRIPPTWTTLEEHCAFLLKQMHTRSQHAQTAILVPAINRTQRTFQIGQARIEALRKSASTRRKSGVGPIIGTQSGTSNKVSSPGSVLGKNPFRRQSLGQSPSNPDCAIKSLKPISAMQVPELPLDLQNSVVMVNMAENTQSRPDLTTNTEMKLDPSLVTKLGHRPRLAGFDSAWSGSEQRTSAKKRSQSIGSRDAKKARAENGAEPDSKKRKQKDKGDVAKKGFDWSAWGTK
ncbi:hypothetical protein H0H92_002676 [Tricholoma furcatifolium]|nr:hypothetical protein H0H92_002676 [Tricholoma furcatifolium]